MALVTRIASNFVLASIVLLLPGVLWPAILSAAAAAGQDEKGTAETDPPRAIVLEGKVLGPQDHPVAKARLYLSVDEWTDPIELGASEADGSYRFEVAEKVLRRRFYPSSLLADCQAALLVTATGLGAGWVELPAAGGNRFGPMKPQYSYEFHLATELPIAGRIVDAEGRPVAGAEVTVDRIHDLGGRRWYKMLQAIKANDLDLMTRNEANVNHWASRLYPTAWQAIPPATTDAQGRFQIAGVGADRAVRMRVEGPGIDDAFFSVISRDDVAEFTKAIREKFQTAGGVALYDLNPVITVTRARTLSGVVRDAGTGQPIGGANLYFQFDEGGDGLARTDIRGRYRVVRPSGRGVGSGRVRFDDDQHYLSAARTFAEPDETDEIVVDFNVSSGILIGGRVVETQTGRPIVAAPRSGCHVGWPGPLLAGYVEYYPLATNKALAATPTGAYFAQETPPGYPPHHLSARIDGDGRFQIAVPPGPGVVLVRARTGLPPLAEYGGVWKESDGLQNLFPYVGLETRHWNDGAPLAVWDGFEGLGRRVPFGHPEAYQVIDPPADAASVDLELKIPRAPSRTIRLVDPAGQELRGVLVTGLVPWNPLGGLTVEFEGSQSIVTALTPDQPRQIIACSLDGRLAVRTFVALDDPEPRTIRLAPTGTVTGRLVDGSTGRPLVGCSVYHPHAYHERREDQTTVEVKTDAEGRFVLRGILPEVLGSIWFQAPPPEVPTGADTILKPTALQNLSLAPGENWDLGEIRSLPPGSPPAPTPAGAPAIE